MTIGAKNDKTNWLKNDGTLMPLKTGNFAHGRLDKSRSRTQAITMKQVSIEGPLDVGKWTTVVQAGFKAIGLDSAVHYHNAVDPLSKISNRMHNLFRRLGLPGVFVTWKQMSDHRLQSLVRRQKSQLLMSLHGTIDHENAEALRRINPRLRIIYWWSYPVRREEQISRLLELNSFVDVLAVPFQGDAEMLRSKGAHKTVFMPFAACPYTHRVQLNPRMRRKWGREVIFVGTHGEYEEELVRRVSEALGRPVDVWGAGWTNTRWARFNGYLVPPHSHYAYAASTIVLNAHGPSCMQHNGLNPTFYEIAAVGGFQITEEQPFIRSGTFARHVACFKDSRDLAQKVPYYLQEQGVRESMVNSLQEHVLHHETYGHRLFSLLKSMGYSE